MSFRRAVLAALAALLLVLPPASPVAPAGGVRPALLASLVDWLTSAAPPPPRPSPSSPADVPSNERARTGPAAGRLGTQAGLPPHKGLQEEGRPAAVSDGRTGDSAGGQPRSNRDQADIWPEDSAGPDGDDSPAAAAAFRLASFGTWRRIYVASLHTKPDQQGRAFQLTLPDPWATGCYAVDVPAASYSELHRDFRVEVFTAEECREGGKLGVLLPAPPARRPGPAPGSDHNNAGAARDEHRDPCPDCRRAGHTRGNFLKPGRVRSVRFHHAP